MLEVLSSQTYRHLFLAQAIAAWNRPGHGRPSPHSSPSFPKQAKTAFSREDSGFTYAGEYRLGTG